MRLAVLVVILAASSAWVGAAVALEPWVAPDVARACPQYGPGFIKLPGTTTCVRISGRVRADYEVGGRRPTRERLGGERLGGFGTSGRVTVDSRTQTDYGPLRLIYRMDVGEEGRFRR